MRGYRLGGEINRLYTDLRLTKIEHAQEKERVQSQHLEFLDNMEEILQNPAERSQTAASAQKVAKISFREPQDFVTIHVGKSTSFTKKKTYVVHKALICQLSPFFEAAFNSKFIEGETQTMELADVDTDAFGLLVHWLYTSTISTDPQPTMKTLSNIWYLAKRFLIPELRDATMQALDVLITPIVVPSEEFLQIIAEVYGKRLENSQFLHGVLVAHVSSIATEHFDAWMAVIPSEMAKDVACFMKRRLSQSETSVSDALFQLRMERQLRTAAFYPPYLHSM